MLVFLFRHEFHKKCVDPWLKIKQNCPMCKCSITRSPPVGTPLSRGVAAHSGSPITEEEDDLSMITLSREQDGSPQPNVPQESDTVSSDTVSSTLSDQASDAPLLPTTDEGPTVEIMPYSPQVEVNIESLLPGEGKP